MARILICEPSDEVRALLLLVVQRLGHEPVSAETWSASEHPRPDVVLVEPDDPGCLALAVELRRAFPTLPLIVCSILGPGATSRALAPLAHLLKPFRRADLDRALQLATASTT